MLVVIRVADELEPIQDDFGQKADYILYWAHANHRTSVKKDTFTPKDKIESAVNQPCVFFYVGGNRNTQRRP